MQPRITIPVRATSTVEPPGHDGLPAVRELYAAFDRVLKPPTTLWTSDCCVHREEILRLCHVPRHEQGARELLYVMRHAGGCFGSLRSVAYFLPRLVELASGPDVADQVEEVWWDVVARRSFYHALGLWTSIVGAADGIFRDATSQFDYEVVTGLAAWNGSPRAIQVRHLVHDFYWPEMKQTPQQWDAFYWRWASDPDPNRAAYLLDLIVSEWDHRRQWLLGRRHGLCTALPPIPGSVMPEPFERRLCDDDLIAQLLHHSAPVWQAAAASGWENHLRNRIEGRPRGLDERREFLAECEVALSEQRAADRKGHNALAGPKCQPNE